MPNPSNPQSWNRYLYALNNPVRYNDPSGHRECEVDSKGNCMGVRKLNLWNYAADTLNKLGGKGKGRNSVEAMAQIVDKAAQLYGTSDKMIPELSEIFLGVHESNSLTVLHATRANPCAALGREPKDCGFNSNNGAFWDTGFNKDFQDTHNQVFHFWAYLATAANTEGRGPASYISGRVVSGFANAYHEIYSPDGPGATWQDFALTSVAVNIGTLVNMGAVTPSQLGNTIRDYVGTGSPGAFYVDPLKRLMPLEGNR